jgi:hypothetical protein
VHPVADRQDFPGAVSANRSPERLDDADRLMAEGEWRGGVREVPGQSMGVRAADPGQRHADQKLVLGWVRDVVDADHELASRAGECDVASPPGHVLSEG